MSYSFEEFKALAEQDKQEREKYRALVDQKSSLVKKYGKDVQIFTQGRVRIPAGSDYGVLILDRELDKALLYKEHKVIPNGDFKKTYFVSCFSSDPGVGEGCPLCRASSRKENGISFPSFVVGLTVFLVKREVVDGKLKLSPVPNYVGQNGPVYGKQLWVVSDNNVKAKLLGILDTVNQDYKTIRGLYIPLTRESDKSAAHGSLGMIDGGKGIAKTYEHYGDKAEAIIQMLAKKIQPEPITTKEGKLLSAELVPSHDWKWASEPLNCYSAMIERVSYQQAVKTFDPGYVEKLDDAATLDDVFSLDSDESSEDESLEIPIDVKASEELEPAKTVTPGGRAKKINLTKPEVKQTDFVDELEEFVETPKPKKKEVKTVVEDDFDDFDLE